MLIRTLKLKSVSLYDRIVIQDNEIEMLWNVRGCHKIKINGIGVFPGNTHGLKFLFSNRYNPIEVTFIGIARKIKKKIRVENTKINLLNKFNTSTEIPIAIEVPYNRGKFECKLSTENLIMKQSAFNVELQNIYFEFEPFDIDNYKQVKTNQ